MRIGALMFTLVILRYKQVIDETWRFWTNYGAKQKRCQKSTETQKIRCISHNRYAIISYVHEFQNHFLALKNAPHVTLSCAAYETLVKEEDQARSTPDTPHYTFDIRRITIKTSPNNIQDTREHAPHKRMKLRRI